ncbi:hypothetical protein JDM601_2097 [Mycolicibacter sinensis]|uniref:Uncharacterized protein n=1 Tax=Mycolicibacter sinensis (strain JDM601) TaxID=875328 RepID=F5YSU5_MYCSD|nr:hypothetical protein JDM601_2097 [Mycolicibacter sinensis]
MPYPRPRLSRLGRPKAEWAHRRPGIRNGTPPAHPVAGETLHDTGGDAGLHRVVMHEPNVSEPAGG